jgi:hypothetical protein
MIPDEDKFLEILTDVVIRYKGHGSYKNEEGALKAFKKRAKAYSPGSCREAFEITCRVYDAAVALLSDRRYIKKANPASIYAEFEDVDFKACVAELRKAEPAAGDKIYGAILSWAILWFYLK